MQHLVILGLTMDEGFGAAALLHNGVLVAACQEQNEDSRICFPKKSVSECLRLSELDAASIEVVCLARKPFMHFESRLESRIEGFPQGWIYSGLEIFNEADSELGLSRRILRELSKLSPHLGNRSRLLFIDGPIGLAAWSYFTSPFHYATVAVRHEGVAKNDETMLMLVGQGGSLKVMPLCTNTNDEKLISCCLDIPSKRSLCLAGNFTTTDWILRWQHKFTESSIWQPSGSNQYGASVGAALATYYIYFGRNRTVPMEEAKQSKVIDLSLWRSEGQKKRVVSSLIWLRILAIFIIPLLILLTRLTRTLLRNSPKRSDYCRTFLPGMPTPASFHDQY